MEHQLFKALAKMPKTFTNQAFYKQLRKHKEVLELEKCLSKTAFQNSVREFLLENCDKHQGKNRYTKRENNHLEREKEVFLSELEKIVCHPDIRFEIGQSFYLKTDNDQKERFLVGILIRPCGIKYILSCGTDESWHYDFEITKTRDIIKATS